ncbi:uncharacterized protein METZ01_LOCUS272970 [marine metagenome]|uniref:Uncharacterized protein n=1 Tax=marine metagenome TaxID=408172 RepID=A0A382K7W8_9ZZZZ
MLKTAKFTLVYASDLYAYYFVYAYYANIEA